MKRALILTAAILLASAAAPAHEPGEDSATVDLGGGKVTIEYGTPKLGDRKIDEMIRPGQPWRMGMNKPTTLETTVALDFGGKKLDPGKYTLYARADEQKNWTLLITKGAASNVVVEAALHLMKEDKAQDLLKIKLEKTQAGAALWVVWGTYRLHGTFKAA